MKLRTLIAACVCVVACCTNVWAQDSEPPTGSEQDAAAEPDSAEPEKKGIPLGLYVYSGLGEGDPDPYNTSIVTTATANSENTLDIDTVTYSRFAVGWKLPNKKGDFRLIMDAWAEDGYEYTAVGRQAAVADGSSAGNGIAEPLDWWNVSIRDGLLTAARLPPRWSLNQDANADGFVNRNEVTYPDMATCDATPALRCLTFDRNVTRDLLNRFQNWDLVYGREWGPRRFQGRWFAGLRYFKYEGNILASAWLNDAFPGLGYTDGSFLRNLNFNQDTTALGPTGMLEARWNFFDQRLQFYTQFQAAFMLANTETDTGVFFTLVNTPTAPLVLVPIRSRLNESRDKSVWNTKAEVGIRILLKQGLEIDLAWMIQGYLDSILTPQTIQIPQNPGQAAQGVSAVYNTQDVVLEAFRFGIGFQFGPGSSQN